MGKSLIITEKPSVAREFANVLGVGGRGKGYIENSEYCITWCVGHLVGLVYPEEYDIKYKKWKLEDLPFLPETYKYNVIESVADQYRIVHSLLHRADIDRVYWAGDAGKEGQTIEENIRNFGGVREGMEELRVWIDSQTEEEIQRGIREAKPMSDYANLGKSGIMRTIEDYAMGINFSRAMSVKYARLINAAAATSGYQPIAVGRVMTCVLGMVVEREREIRNFKETPFYRVVGSFTDAGIEAEWKAVEGSAYFQSPRLYKENGFKEEADARALIDSLQGKEAHVLSIDKSTSRKKAPRLFNLAELQAECSKRFKISPDQALQCAQDLYEKKLTTYPRTDARVLSSAVAKEIGKNIGRLKHYEPVADFAEQILDKGSHHNIAKTQYTDDSKVTDHYAIIPTGDLRALGSLNSLERNVYDLIVRRFLSIFYPPAEYENVKLTVGVEKESFFASARILKKPGYLEIANPALAAGKADANADKDNKEEEGAVADPKALLKLAQTLKKGEEIEVKGYQIKQGKTSPPKRYTSGSMVLAMENAGQLIEDEELRAQIKGSGIGTSATRAEIIAKLVRIRYLALNKKTQILTPENLGEMVYEVVRMTVPAMLNPKMTASWEKGLDGITRGTVDFAEYRSKLEDYIRRETLKMIGQDIKEPLSAAISEFAGKNAAGFKKSLGIACPLCKEGEITTTPFGYGCSRYSKDKSGCNFTIGQICGVSLDEDDVRELLTQGRTGVINGFKSKAGKRFNAALKLSTAEDGKVTVGFDFSDNSGDKVEGLTCPQCGSAILKTGYGWRCEKHVQGDAASCAFSIGQIAGKKLTQKDVDKLLKEGRTDTIRGFKSKAGKRFDGCLALKKDETGKVSIVFDFDHVEDELLPEECICPVCGGRIKKTSFGWGCVNYNKDVEGSCRFSIGQIGGKKLSAAQVKQLLKNGQTDTISGFKSKAGKRFDAALTFAKDENGKVTGLKYAFPDAGAASEQKESILDCPKCGKTLKKGRWSYECECGFRLQHTVAKVSLSEEILKELLTTGKTKSKVEGFTSKAGKVFDTCLKYEDDTIKFDFDNPGEGGVKGPAPKKDAGMIDFGKLDEHAADDVLAEIEAMHAEEEMTDAVSDDLMAQFHSLF